jgi:hypothetical protein
VANVLTTSNEQPSLVLRTAFACGTMLAFNRVLLPESRQQPAVLCRAIARINPSSTIGICNEGGVCRYPGLLSSSSISLAWAFCNIPITLYGECRIVTITEAILLSTVVVLPFYLATARANGPLAVGNTTPASNVDLDATFSISLDRFLSLISVPYLQINSNTVRQDLKSRNSSRCQLPKPLCLRDRRLLA